MSSRASKQLRRQVQEQPGVSINAHYMRAEGFISPLPSANELRQLDDLVPGSAEHVLTMIETQQAHRQNIEKTILYGDVKRSNWGLACGLVVCMTFLITSYALIVQGYRVEGTILGTIDLAALVGTFIYGTRSRATERKEKQEKRQR